MHSDRGSEYTFREWLETLDTAHARASMGRVGVCCDCDDAESWFVGFKNQLVHPIDASMASQVRKLANQAREIDARHRELLADLPGIAFPKRDTHGVEICWLPGC